MTLGELDREMIEELWAFTGAELGAEVNGKPRVRVFILSMTKFIELIRRVSESVSDDEIKVGEEEVKKAIQHGVEIALKCPEETNGITFTSPYLRQILSTDAFERLKKVLPLDTSDVLIYINEGNIQQRARQWGVGLVDCRNFLLIHEMIHAYSRLTGKDFVYRGEDDRFDLIASKIFWKWKGGCHVRGDSTTLH